jgi:hypothetical protein
MARVSETARVGTKATNFARAKDWGPCQCGHCRHYEEGRGTCAHPHVIADEEIKGRDTRNHPFVQIEDRCEYQRPPRASIGTAARSSGMRG